MTQLQLDVTSEIDRRRTTVMRRTAWLLLLLLVWAPASAQEANLYLRFETPPEVLDGVSFGVRLKAVDASGRLDSNFIGSARITASAGKIIPVGEAPTQELEVELVEGFYEGEWALAGTGAITLSANSDRAAKGSREISVVPPLEIKAPGAVLAGVPFSVTVQAVESNGGIDRNVNGPIVIEPSAGGLGEDVEYKPGEYLPQITVELKEGVYKGTWRLSDTGPVTLAAHQGHRTGELQLRSLHGLMSLVPPLVAIILALTLRQVLLSLLFGVWLGAVVLSDYSLIGGYQLGLHYFLVESLADVDHAFILLFTACLGGLVSLLARSGGMEGLVQWISVRFARDYRSSQVATWIMGMIIFFDDYANTLLVGNTMRPLTDRYRVSREKLAYIVDSTAAPVSSIAIISTWIGYEMGLIDASFKNLGIQANVYATFLESIVYRYYAIFALIFVLAVAWMGRDFGPMLRAERRAHKEGLLLAEGARPLADPDEAGRALPEDLPLRPMNALLPIITVLVLTIVALFSTGLQSLGSWPDEPLSRAIGTVFGASNSYKALLWATVAGTIVAILMILFQGLMDLRDTLSAWERGVRSMVAACTILILAWAIGDVCKELHTAGYLVEVTRGFLSPRLLPLVVFLISSAVAFATGTSWGTMAIVMPIAVNLGYTLPKLAAFPEELSWSILVGTIASVLAGSAFGDHCSPISDTTIMSSMASACDHVDHVKTQAPYALVTAGIACLVGSLPGGWGVNPWLLNVIGIVLCIAVVRFVGRPVRPDGDRPEEPSSRKPTGDK